MLLKDVYQTISLHIVTCNVNLDTHFSLAAPKSDSEK